MKEPLTGFLTPSLRLPSSGAVHSVFHRSANLLLGDRLITLADPSLPRIPDSVLISQACLAALEPGQPVRLTADALTLNGEEYPCQCRSADDFLLTTRQGMSGAERFLRLTDDLPSGLLRIPAERRRRALEALCTERAAEYLGLGPGLTPSYDDACVGVLAVYRAAGRPAPFRAADLSVTTDVSARYLRLAQEGYFGEPILRVIDGLYGAPALEESIEALKRVGATSGCDMLLGMRRAVRAL